MVHFIKKSILNNFQSGSSLDFYDGKIFVVGDDTKDLLVIDKDFKELNRVRLFDSEDTRIAKDLKTDLETSTIINYGGIRSILMLGSGSKENRCIGYIVPLDTLKVGLPFTYNTFISRLAEKGIKKVNIEGSAQLPDCFLLSNRGNKTNPDNFIITTDHKFWENQESASIFLSRISIPTDAGISELCYDDKTDTLFFTASIENTINSYDDGEIGDSFIGYIFNISSKLKENTIIPDVFTNLTELHPSFNKQKIEGICIEDNSGGNYTINLVSDNDNDESTIFKISISNPISAADGGKFPIIESSRAEGTPALAERLKNLTNFNKKHPSPELEKRIKDLEMIMIDRIAKDLDDLKKKYTERIVEKIKNHNKIIDDHFKKLIARAPEKEKKAITKKWDTQKSRYENSIGKFVKQQAIDYQDRSGVRNEILDWVRKKENNTKIIIAFSGGKDSIACVLNLFELGFKADQMELWHHDVDGGESDENLWDWKCTRSYCEAFAKEFKIPILFSYRKGGITREIFKEYGVSPAQDVYYQTAEGSAFSIKKPEEISLGYYLKEFKLDAEGNPVKDKKGKPKLLKDEKGNSINKKGPDGEDIWIEYTSEELYKKNTKRKFPSVEASLITRWCSSTAKIGVMSKAINNDKRFVNANIIIVSGERRAESVARSLYIEFEKYASYTKARKTISWRTIASWSEEQVWNIIKKYKVQPHPCYELGWGRCSCQLCIFGQRNTWASLMEIAPEKVNRIASIEKEIGHTLYNIKDPTDPNPDPKLRRNLNVIETYKNPSKNAPEGGISFIGIEGNKKVTNYNKMTKKEVKDRWLNEADSKFVSNIIVSGEWKLPKGAFSKEDCGAS